MSAATMNPLHPAEDGHDGIIQKTVSLPLTPPTAPIASGNDIDDISARMFIVNLSPASDGAHAEKKGAKQVELPGEHNLTTCCAMTK